MKRILTTLCALAIVMSGSVPALAADAEKSGQSASYYPISVEEYTYGDFDELRINKVYQLSLSDDPSLIPTEDFVRNGRRYFVIAKFAQLRFRLLRKLRSFPCSSSPRKIYDFAGAPFWT